MAGNREEDEGRLPALLWDEIPEDADTHPDYLAMQALMYDESTPLEQAENFKVASPCFLREHPRLVMYKEQGNQRLRVALKSKNKLYIHEAIKYYTQGIDVELKGYEQLKSVLYSNRAQAEIHLRNWRKALKDSEAALKWNPTNVKACYRGARAAMKLDEVSQALRFCGEGLRADPTSEELTAMHKEVQTRQRVIQQQKKQSEEEETIARKEAEKLLKVFNQRQIRFCQSNFKVGNLRPFVDAEDVLHWPILFVYPETMQQDIVEDVSETDLLSDHLDAMFGADAEPLQWDAAKEYTRDSIDVYYLANAGEPFSQEEMLQVLMGRYHGDPDLHAPKVYGDKSAYFVQIREQQSIGDILSTEDYIVPGVPTFFIVARGSNYHSPPPSDRKEFRGVLTWSNALLAAQAKSFVMTKGYAHNYMIYIVDRHWGRKYRGLQLFELSTVPTASSTLL